MHRLPVLKEGEILQRLLRWSS